jgi:hypothetical protein
MTAKTTRSLVEEKPEGEIHQGRGNLSKGIPGK